MKLKVLSSSSSGNGYVLYNEKECLIIEAGVKLSQVKEALDFNISRIAGCIISHMHKDHAGYLESYARAGIRILTSENVLLQEKDLVASTLCKVVEPGKGYKVGNFKIIPFELAHDVTCYGFHISHPEAGNILFVTDSYLLEYTFEDLNHILLECNYSDDILENNITSGNIHPSMRPRLLNTHMELQTTKGIVQANNNPKLINIVLCHLSSGNSDAERFVREVREVSGKQVYAASSGMELDFNVNPY